MRALFFLFLHMQNKFLFLLTLGIGLTGVSAQTIKKKNIEKHIQYLASDKLKGRGTSSPEEKMAADYIAKQFKSYGLKPFNKSYLKEFTFKKALNPHDTSTAQVKERTGNNVVAFLDNGKPFTIVIGAHYDHLGLGQDKNSLDANPEGKIHNGADDNASGTAGVIELARYFASNKTQEPYNFLFICFSGEELGLIGSKKWCEDPDIDLASVDYMINMDMIGRLNDSTKKLIRLWCRYLTSFCALNRFHFHFLQY
jgi:Zn-dependent M28 family amino/carboxypeptidase